MFRRKSRRFKVMQNDGEYGVWYEDAEPTRGWRDTGYAGSEDDCWDYVEDREERRGFLFRLLGLD